MRDAFNRTIDELEAFIGAWILHNRTLTLAIVVAVLAIFYAYRTYVLDHRS